MKAINKLPTSAFWSLVSVDGQLKVLNTPSRVLEIRRDYSKDLVTGEMIFVPGIETLNTLLSQPVKSYQSKTRTLFHGFYELGHLWMETAPLEKDTILGYWMEFTEEVDFGFIQTYSTKSKDKFSWELPTFSEYKDSYDKGREHLLKGDCYQFNLTFPIEGRFEEELSLDSFASHFMGESKVRGEYASLTKLDNTIYYSNSPECLADLKGEANSLELESRPIKGTVSTKDISLAEAWKKLENSKKDESELYMITDLLRNDLNQIGKPWVEVIEKKAMLEVNQLVHSYSHLKVSLEDKVTLLDILKPLFPGGSITGVPKKRVLQILKNIEKCDRGFYCGSSLLFGKGLLKTSINIRSGKIDLQKNTISYHAGGGITVESHPELEYEEMLSKFSSFNHLINE